MKKETKMDKPVEVQKVETEGLVITKIDRSNGFFEVHLKDKEAPMRIPAEALANPRILELCVMAHIGVWLNLGPLTVCDEIAWRRIVNYWLALEG